MLQQVRVLLFALLVSLSACGPMYETQYTFVPPATGQGRMCVQQCRQGQTLCRQSCEIHQQSCLNDARAHALYEYQAYVRQRNAERQPIKKDIGDFEHTYRCNVDACESRCAADHRDCYSDCGGQVVARQVCVFNCDKVGAQPLTSSSPGPAPLPSSQPFASGPAPSGPVVLPGMTESSSRRSADVTPLCQPGQRVEAMWDGEWYDAVVKAPLRSDGRCPIHYEGYGQEDDEAVAPKRLRPARD